MMHMNANTIDGVVIDLRRIVPVMKDYSTISMTLESWTMHLTQLKALSSEKRLQKLRNFKKLVRKCHKSMHSSKCYTLKITYYLNLIRFSVSTALIAYTLLHIHNPKGYPVRKIVTEAGTKEIMSYLHNVKRRWSSVKQACVHLCTDENVFYNVGPCKCHPKAFDKHIKPHLSLRSRGTVL